MSYDKKLKAQIAVSITKVFKQALDDVELFVATVEGVLQATGDDDTKIRALNGSYQAMRKRLLGVGNDEIRKIQSIVDAFELEAKPGYDLIIFDQM